MYSYKKIIKQAYEVVKNWDSCINNKDAFNICYMFAKNKMIKIHDVEDVRMFVDNLVINNEIITIDNIEGYAENFPYIADIIDEETGFILNYYSNKRSESGNYWELIQCRFPIRYTIGYNPLGL